MHSNSPSAQRDARLYSKLRNKEVSVTYLVQDWLECSCSEHVRGARTPYFNQCLMSQIIRSTVINLNQSVN